MALSSAVNKFSVPIQCSVPIRCHEKLKVIGRPQWRRFILVSKLLFGLTIELLISIGWFTRLLPEFVSANLYLLFGRIWHGLTSRAERP
jgi:hypothetical protein